VSPSTHFVRVVVVVSAAGPASDPSSRISTNRSAELHTVEAWCTGNFRSAEVAVLP
jgi:hypothetical protein